MDAQAYFRRIGVSESAGKGRPAGIDRLRELTRAHTQAIPFENLNTLMRLPVHLDLASLEDKLVHSARGGYCFEHNAYFAAVLERLGFTVRRLAARVVWGRSAADPWLSPRTHMVLLVDTGGKQYLCDVGFGGFTPTAPLLFKANDEQPTPHEPFRIVEHDEMFVLQVCPGAEWLDMYLFDLQAQSRIDYEMANHYVATHPASHFRNTLMAARPFEGGRYALRNRAFTVFRKNGVKEQRVLGETDEVIEVLRSRFLIDLPDRAALHAAFANIREEET